MIAFHLLTRSDVVCAAESLKKEFWKKHDAHHTRFHHHPWLGRGTASSTMTDELRILTFISGQTAVGNVTGVCRDW